MPNRVFFYAFLAYLLFVIYGSLVPLDYKPIPITDALSHFKAIRLLDLGIESRADWVANILLYIPLAFLGVAASSAIKQPLTRLIAIISTSVFCLATAVGIEFIQQFFPPRTVSINDLIAESLGTAIGIAIWLGFGKTLTRLYQQLSLSNLLSAKAAVLLYLCVYTLLNLFPFDFVKSFLELEDKLASDSVGLFIAPDALSNGLRFVVRLLIEILLLMPVGYLLCLRAYNPHKLSLNLIFGLLLGLVLESLQLLVFSSTAQGISVVTRMAGMGLGTLLFRWQKKQQLSDWQPRFRPIVCVAIIPYLLLAIAINDGFNGTWLSPSQAAAKLADTHFLPLYYFYYTTETLAMVSLLSNVALYLPIGVLFCLYALGTGTSYKPHWATVGFSSFGFAIIIEIGKLFLQEKHADPTDLAIAFIAAAGSYQLLQQLSQRLMPNPAVTDIPNISPSNSAANANYQFNRQALPLLIPLVLGIFWMLVDYPLHNIALTLGLLAYARLLWLYPNVWLIVLPALLPIADFAPWTGRFFIDEFDLLLATTVAVHVSRKYHARLPRLFSLRTGLLLAAFVCTYTASMLIGLLPLAEWDANAFNNYYSNYNSLRIAKGVAWAFLLLPLLKRSWKNPQQTRQYFSYGLLIGLSGVAIFTLIERWVFPGISDFSTDYRINALFSTMHTGGGHIESYLALTMPFIATLFFAEQQRLAKAALATLLFAGSVYTLLMTYSRGGYLSLVAAATVLAIGLLICYRQRLFSIWQNRSAGILPANAIQAIYALVLLALAASIAIPVLNGSYIQQRFNIAEQDKNLRSAHWQDALAMRDDSILTSLFGMGLGSYPRTFFWLNNEDSHIATYQIASEAGNPYLRLGGGDALFLGQYLDIKPHSNYLLSMDIRSAEADLSLNVSLCEKSLQYAFRCQTINRNTQGGNWLHVETSLNSEVVGEKSADIAGGILSRPIQLAFYNGNGFGKFIAIDNVQLTDSDGNKLINNGDFTDGSDFWFFSTEKHNPWHIFNLWVDVLFATGYLGLLAFSALLLITLYRLCSRLKTDSFAAIQLAAFSGFLVVGFVDSPFDAPRLTWLFFMMVFFTLASTRKRYRTSSPTS